MHYSPQVALLEAVLGYLLFAVFLHHSWRYDRFASLKIWELKSSRDVFKKVMTLAYFFGIPSFAVGGTLKAMIKYDVGFFPVADPVGKGMPVPMQFWDAYQRGFVNPLGVLDVLTWFFDLTVHHQELTFWFWLVRASPQSPPWFQSVWFKFFLAGTLAYAGCFAALTKLFYHDELVLERSVDLAYSIGTIIESIAFAYIFAVFPKFIRNAKSQGGTSEVLGRLLSFHELNKYRVAARCLFGCCLLVLAVDAFTPAQRLNRNLPVLDALLFVSIVANIASALLTLLVFMPRAILKEHGLESTRSLGTSTNPTQAGQLPAVVVQQSSRTDGVMTPSSQSDVLIIPRPSMALPRPRHHPARPHRANQSEDYDVASPVFLQHDGDVSSYYADDEDAKEALEMMEQHHAPKRPARPESQVPPFTRLADGSQVPVPSLSKLRRTELERRRLMNPALANYRSPIDIAVYHSNAPTFSPA